MSSSTFQLAARLLRGFADPAVALFDPSRRVYGPYLLVAFVMALAVQLAHGRSVRHGVCSLFARRVWLAPSSWVDLRFIALKGFAHALLFGVAGVSSLVVGALVAGWLRRSFGDALLHVPRGIAATLLTLAAFLVDDLSRFALHRAMHRSPWLWAFHRVHHAAEVLTPFTLYRTHPVESVLNQGRAAVGLGVVTGVGAWLFGPSLRAWEVLGVDAVGFVWTLFGANLRHSHVWLSYGPRIERWLMSPAQHQVHHSADPRHHDKNFGEVLSLWDRLAGSLHVTTSTPEPLRFGLPDGDPLAGRGALASMVLPFLMVAHDAAQKVSSMSRMFRTPTPLILLCLTVVSAGCTESTPVDRAAVLQAFARCTVATAREFSSTADALAGATEAYASTPDEAHRERARGAWLAAMDVWQRAEMMRFGPAAPPSMPGGRNLRDVIYAWPDFNRCLVDQNLVNRAWEQGASSLGVNARGLATVEYLLFYTGSANGCPSAEPINATGAWSALSPMELTARRAAYARAVAADVATQARALVSAWEPMGFGTQLTTAGRGSTLFATQPMAVSAVANGVFHVDTDLKDLRLARPLGRTNCPTGTCPEAAESPWSERGVRHMRNNLVGVRTLLEGCSAGGNLGFDDLLDAVGAAALTAQMRARLDAAEAALRAVPVEGTVAALDAHRPALQRAYDAVRELSSFLKMEFTTALQIQGSRVEGDND